MQKNETLPDVNVPLVGLIKINDILHMRTYYSSHHTNLEFLNEVFMLN